MENYKYIIVLAFLFNWLSSFAQPDFGDSGDCQDDRNVNCDYWATSLNNPKRAVFLWSVEGTCTGILINQKVSDNEIEQYFISSKHCITDVNMSQVFDFYFNYQSPDCDNESVPAGNAPQGNRDGRRYIHSSTVTKIDIVSLTDFIIYKIDNPIPPHYNVYYAGWTVANYQETQFPHYDIHHPSGDIKKIAKTFYTVMFTDYACHTITTIIDVIFSWFGLTTNTEVICVFTESPFYDVHIWSKGVTESGSSGSALLNSNTRIIGNLSFGGA